MVVFDSDVLSYFSACRLLLFHLPSIASYFLHSSGVLKIQAFKGTSQEEIS